MGGEERLRPYWRHYYTGTQGVLFVVDAADRARLPLAALELKSMAADEQLAVRDADREPRGSDQFRCRGARCALSPTSGAPQQDACPHAIPFRLPLQDAAVVVVVNRRKGAPASGGSAAAEGGAGGSSAAAGEGGAAPPLTVDEVRAAMELEASLKGHPWTALEVDAADGSGLTAAWDFFAARTKPI